MWDVIRTQVREGATLLLTTQYLEEADELADEIAVVDHGKIIARGTADQLKSQVGGERIEVVVHERDALERASTLLAPDGTGAIDRHTRRLTIAADGGAAQLVDVVRRLGEERIKVDDVGLRRPTLDDVFLALTGHAAEDRSPPRTRRWRHDRDHSGRQRRPRHDLAQPEAGAADPGLAIFAILQSIMFVLLFAYVFGAIPLPDGGSYREYLMPGIFVQTLGFASITTAIAVTDDMAKG